MAAGDGLVTMTPTSIVVAGAGSSASINADGGVDFTSATSLSLNGVFTASHDNYALSIRITSGPDATATFLRLRTAGTDASGSNYTFQYLAATSTTISGARSSSQTEGEFGRTYTAVNQNATFLNIYGPYLAKPTAYRSVTAYTFSSAYMNDLAGTHSLSTSYDGLTIYPGSSSISGNIVVFGYEE